MSIAPLLPFLPENTLPYLRKWFGDHAVHIRVTRERQSKLGDYRRLRDKSHEITLNCTLQPQLFFFVLTHELAHLHAFVQFGYRIAPHGTEWKNIFREMLLESLPVYKEDLRPIIINFSKAPKANFMASPDLVRYFHVMSEGDTSVFVEEVPLGGHFTYRGDRYKIEDKSKKNYICSHLNSGKKYSFRPLARVEKIEL